MRTLLGILVAALLAPFQHAYVPYLRRRSHRVLFAGDGDLPRADLLKQARASGYVDDVIAAHTLDVAGRALASWEVLATHFLRPPEIAALSELFVPFGDVATACEGGFEDAERRVLFLGRTEVFDALMGEALQDVLAAVAIEGNFKFDSAGHRDFLGAILKVGIRREFVGDIIILPNGEGAQVVTTPQVGDALCLQLSRVRTVPVKCSHISLEELRPQPVSRRPVTSVEASLRLDAIASGGMGIRYDSWGVVGDHQARRNLDGTGTDLALISRSIASEMARSGDILLNWKPVKSAAKEVTTGDVITIRGKGRVEVHHIESTNKGKFRIDMTRLS